MVSDLKTFTFKGCKIVAQKKRFCANFALLSRIFLVSVFLTPFNSIFAPTSRNPMSKHFRILESLGKNHEKKWSLILKLFLIKGVISPWQKSFFTFFLLHLFSQFKGLFAPTSQSPMSNFFQFLEYFHTI